MFNLVGITGINSNYYINWNGKNKKLNPHQTIDPN
jgi:hypothetical protein